MDSEHKQQIQAQFGGSAEAYVVSATHAEGDDLDQLVAWAEGGPNRVALDVATGAGHTALALAPRFERVVASDLTPRMLETAAKHAREVGVGNVEFRQADAEALPFEDASFDLVSCRIAPHHFDDVGRFVSEVARVLKPGGVFLLEDSVVPDDPEAAEFLNRAEKLRDATHVRSLAASEWRALLLGAGLTPEAEQLFAKPHPFASWVERARTPEESRRALVAAFYAAPATAREALAIQLGPDGEVLSYTDEKLLIKSRKARLTEEE